MHDLTLVAGQFLDQSVPKDKEYLLHYFDQPMQRAFIAYYFYFPGLDSRGTAFFHRLFCDHTGLYCSLRIVQTWLKRVKDIEVVAKQASDRCDLGLLHEIKSGQSRLTRFRCQKQS
jgi:hypothetical protein